MKVITAGPDSFIVPDFGVRINSNCDTTVFTNKYGIAQFRAASTGKIYVDYNEEYTIKDKSANSFVITMDSYPIYTSPKDVTWTEWVINKHKVNPIECGKILNYITLKRM